VKIPNDERIEAATAVCLLRSEAGVTAHVLLDAMVVVPQMRPGMECLLELLRGQSTAHARDGAQWEAALVLAEEERVLPWASACLREQSASLTPAMVQRLDKIERDAAIAGFYWSSQLKGVLRAFNQSNIVPVALKGPYLAERLYGSTALRVSRDLDLLVSAEDVPKAEVVLAELGFTPGEADDYHRPWYRQSAMLELHHDVENPLAFDFDVAAALRRAEAAQFQGEGCRRLAAEDELLFLCLHAVRHRFERLSLVLDLQFAFEKLPATVKNWHPRAEVADLNNLLILGMAMARRLQPEIGADFVCAVSKREAEHLEALADRLWRRLLTQSSEPLDWSTLHAFYVEMELPGLRRLRRRWRHIQILAERVIEPDYIFAAQFGLKRAWQARMLRPLRLLSTAASRACRK
jgi:hypothetical protein